MMEIRSGLPIIGFADQKELEDWLTGQPVDATGVWIKFGWSGSRLASRVVNGPRSTEHAPYS